MTERTTCVPRGQDIAEQEAPARRRNAVRAGLVFILILLAALAVYLGRQHKVVLENRAPEGADAASVQLPAVMLAAVNQDTLTPGPSAVPPAKTESPFISLSLNLTSRPDVSIAKPIEIKANEHVVIKVNGPSFDLKIMPLDKDGRPTGDLVAVDVPMGFTRNALINLDRLSADKTVTLEAYSTARAAKGGGFGTGRRPGAIDADTGGADAPRKTRRPGGIDLDEMESSGEADAPKKTRRPGGIDLDEMETTAAPDEAEEGRRAPASGGAE